MIANEFKSAAEQERIFNDQVRLDLKVGFPNIAGHNRLIYLA